MADDPFTTLILALITLYVFGLWWKDLRSAREGKPHPRALPGATACSGIAVLVAVVGALLILALETGGEVWLGIAEAQSEVAPLALVLWVCAAFYEELTFRGFLVVTRRGRAGLVASAVGFSLVFALLHPFLWDFALPESCPLSQWWRGFTFTVDTKAVFSTAIVFVNALWFYTVRFYSLNPQQSLIPCFAAHLASNLGVFAIKLAQGYVVLG